MDACLKLIPAALHAKAATACVLSALRTTLVRTPLWVVGLDGFVPPRPGNTSISARWVTRVLRRAKMLPDGVKVATAELRDLEGNRGFIGAMSKIHVTYTSKDPAAVEGLPATFLLKMSHRGFTGRRWCMQFQTYREAMFYGSELARKVPAGYTAQAFYTHSSPALGECVMMLEDIPVMRSGVQPLNFVMGNQLWGLPDSANVPASCTPLYGLRCMFLSAAKQHALFWNDSALLQHKWLNGRREHVASSFWNRLEYAARMAFSRQAWAITKSKMQDGGVVGDVTYPPAVVDMLDTELGKSLDDQREAAKRFPFTLVHQDFHASNAFLLTETDSVVMIDWPEAGIGQPLRDLAQCVISDLQDDAVWAQLKDLVAEYVQELKRGGVDMDSDLAWQAFLHGGRQRWAWMLGLLSNFPVPDSFRQYLVDQVSKFLALE